MLHSQDIYYLDFQKMISAHYLTVQPDNTLKQFFYLRGQIFCVTIVNRMRYAKSAHLGVSVAQWLGHWNNIFFLFIFSFQN